MTLPQGHTVVLVWQLLLPLEQGLGSVWWPRLQLAATQRNSFAATQHATKAAG